MCLEPPELEFRRFGSPEFARYMPSLAPFPLDLEPLQLSDPFPLVSPLCSCRKRPEPSTPKAPPPRDLVTGEPGHPGDRFHLHPNGDTMLSPPLPLSKLAVPCIVAGELAALSDPGLTMTAVGPIRQPHVLTLGPRPSGSNLARVCTSALGRPAAYPSPSAQDKGKTLPLFFFFFCKLVKSTNNSNDIQI